MSYKLSAYLVSVLGQNWVSIGLKSHFLNLIVVLRSQLGFPVSFDRVLQVISRKSARS